jgi:hypothetical protein
MAGYRGQAPYITFLFFRLVMPIVFLIGAIVYVFCFRTCSSRPDEDRHVPRRDMARHAGPDAVPEERHHQAAAVDQARISGCARPCC